MLPGMVGMSLAVDAVGKYMHHLRVFFLPSFWGCHVIYLVRPMDIFRSIMKLFCVFKIKGKKIK